MVMNLVMFAWFVSTDAFGGVDDETLKQMLYKDREAMLDEEMLDFGFISTETNSSTADYEQMIADQKAWKEL